MEIGWFTKKRAALVVSLLMLICALANYSVPPMGVSAEIAILQQVSPPVKEPGGVVWFHVKVKNTGTVPIHPRASALIECSGHGVESSGLQLIYNDTDHLGDSAYNILAPGAESPWNDLPGVMIPNPLTGYWAAGFCDVRFQLWEGNYDRKLDERLLTDAFELIVISGELTGFTVT